MFIALVFFFFFWHVRSFSGTEMYIKPTRYVTNLPAVSDNMTIKAKKMMIQTSRLLCIQNISLSQPVNLDKAMYTS